MKIEVGMQKVKSLSSLVDVTDGIEYRETIESEGLEDSYDPV